MVFGVNFLSDEGQYVKTWHITSYAASKKRRASWSLFTGLFVDLYALW